LLASFRDVRDAVVDVGRARVGVDDFGIGVRGLLDGFGEVEAGGFGARADVVRFADGVGRGGVEGGLDDIGDVDEVAGLGAVALDGDSADSVRYSTTSNAQSDCGWLISLRYCCN
jgi:hypothetical protein